MSLINQMLQDLEKRSASDDERGQLLNQVRALPRAEKSSNLLWWLLGGMAAVALLTVLAWQFYKRTALSTPPAQVAAPVPPAVKVPPPPAPPAVVASTPPAPPAAAAPAPPPPAPRLTLELKAAPSSRAESNAAAPKAAAKPPLPATAIIAAEPGSAAKPGVVPPPGEPAKAVAPALSKPAPARVVEAEAKGRARTPAAPGDSKIDKHSPPLTPQQQAENEYRNALNLRNQGGLAEAQEGFRLALRHNPEHLGARQGLLNLLLAARKDGEAEQVLLEGLRLNPERPEFVMALARMQVDRGDTAGAIALLQKNTAVAQSSPDNLAFLAALLQRQARHKEAVEHYQAALRMAPNSGVWLMGLGISLQALNRIGDAQEVFRRAKATNTLNPELQAFVDQRLKQLQ